jgi:hypothetical protein
MDTPTFSVISYIKVPVKKDAECQNSHCSKVDYLCSSQDTLESLDSTSAKPSYYPIRLELRYYVFQVQDLPMNASMSLVDTGKYDLSSAHRTLASPCNNSECYKLVVSNRKEE